MAVSAAILSKRSASPKAEAGTSLAEAKAHFSKVVTRVEQRRQTVTILRRGRPVAQIVPIVEAAPSLYGSMRGTVVELGDIVGPAGEGWTVRDEH